jgi:hypothetical protein
VRVKWERITFDEYKAYRHAYMDRIAFEDRFGPVVWAFLVEYGS